MHIQELKKLRPALKRYVARFVDCIKTKPSRGHLETYVAGQLGPLERKSVEPIALEAGVPPRSLQQFLAVHRWDEQAVARRHRELVRRDHGDKNAIGVVDETSFAKKGDKTVCVHRQYCGTKGKVDNCVVSVHLGYVTDDFHTLLDGDLYLPEGAWVDDQDRRREAWIPKEVVYRPKWRIALDILGRSLREGVPLGWLTADETYGHVTAFRDSVAGWGLRYVVEIPSNLTGWTQAPKIELAGTLTPAGRVLKKPRVADDQRPARPVSDLWPRGGPPWKQYQIKDTQKGLSVWRVRESHFFPSDGSVPGKPLRLLVAQEVLSGEIKYFLSNAPPEVPLKVLLCVAFSRWHIEQLFEDGKGEVGLDHFEVRKYPALMRHLILTMLSLYFLAEQTGRLREKKSLVVPVPGQGSG